LSTRQLMELLETTTETLDSTLANIDLAASGTLEFARKAGFYGDELEKIGLAVREVVANAIIHGNRLDQQKKVLVSALRTADKLRISVWDQGKGFDLLTLSDPRSPEILLRDHGRGIYMARAFMDEFHVHTGAAGGTTVSLVKYICKNDDHAPWKERLIIGADQAK
jgi:serine/threonine-protein kinase RsbW